MDNYKGNKEVNSSKETKKKGWTPYVDKVKILRIRVNYGYDKSKNNKQNINNNKNKTE